MAGLIGGDDPPVVSLVAAGDDDAARSQHVLLQLALAVEVIVALEDGVGCCCP
jgi:hypothetical protein